MKSRYNKIRKTREFLFFITDLFMVGLVIINLIWMSVDWFFTSPLVKDILNQYVPFFFHFYNDYVHGNFLLFDAIFVSIFITELIIQWAIAIKRKTYHKWFFYPFIHWYDVLGCIPLGSFRFLRLLRVISMTYRLQKLGVINLKKTYLYKLFKKYYDILVEEVSDRVVVNILEGIQDEVQRGGPITDKMITEVIKPHKASLVEWLSQRIRRVTEHNYGLHKDDIKQYLNNLVKESIEKNDEMKRIEKIPFVGSSITTSLEKAISDITYNAINSAVEDLISDHNNKVIEDITDIAFEMVFMEEKDEKINEIVRDIALQSLELVKEQVKIQQWKIKELEERKGKQIN
ncbi:ion transporter [bacterium AH-315-M05]|nr:ion transporter [bacterium AH-315-M05]